MKYNTMRTLTTDQISTIISALRARAKHRAEQAEFFEKMGDGYMVMLCNKQADEATALKDYFEKINDRVYDSKRGVARITITL